jgi:CubicO group peptidase (beta-lactamase class C family)
VLDAARLARLHLADGTIDGHRVLAPHTAQRMRTISSPGKPVDLGLGWYRKHNTATGPPHLEHIGAGGGYDNAMRIYPNLDLGLVVMANTTAPLCRSEPVARSLPVGADRSIGAPNVAACRSVLIRPR